MHKTPRVPEYFSTKKMKFRFRSHFAENHTSSLLQRSPHRSAASARPYPNPLSLPASRRPLDRSPPPATAVDPSLPTPSFSPAAYSLQTVRLFFYTPPVPSLETLVGGAGLPADGVDSSLRRLWPDPAAGAPPMCRSGAGLPGSWFQHVVAADSNPNLDHLSCG